MSDPEQVRHSHGKSMAVTLGGTVALIVLAVMIYLVFLGPQLAAAFNHVNSMEPPQVYTTASCKKPPTMTSAKAVQRAEQYYDHRESSHADSMMVDKNGPVEVVDDRVYCNLAICITYHDSNPTVSTGEQQANFEFFLNGMDGDSGTPGPWTLTSMIPFC